MVYEPIDQTSVERVMLGDKVEQDALVVEGRWLRVKLGASERGSVLRIFDLSGRCIKMQQVDKALERIDLTTLPSGNYIVKSLSTKQKSCAELILIDTFFSMWRPGTRGDFSPPPPLPSQPK